MVLQQSADTLTLKPSGEFSVPEKPATIASEVHFLTNPNRNRVLRKGIRIRTPHVMESNCSISA